MSRKVFVALAAAAALACVPMSTAFARGGGAHFGGMALGGVHMGGAHLGTLGGDHLGTLGAGHFDRSGFVGNHVADHFGGRHLGRGRYGLGGWDYDACYPGATYAYGYCPYQPGT